MAKKVSKVKEINRKSPSFFVTLVIVVVVIAGCLFIKNFEDPYSDCLTDVPTAAAKAMEQLKAREHIDFLYHNEETVPGVDTDAILADILNATFVPNENPDEGDYAALDMIMPEKTGLLEAPQKDGTEIIYFTVKAKHLTTKNQETSFARSAGALLEALDLDGQSDYEKAKAIYGYICNKISYDPKKPAGAKDDTYLTAYGANETGSAASSGFAQFFYYLAVASGLDCRIVVGENHTYNLVSIDGICYIADAAWDAGKDEAGWECFLTGTDEYDKAFDQDEDVNFIDALSHTADGVNISAAAYK